MADNQHEDAGRNTIFLSSLNVLIEELSRLLREYKDAQLAFAQDIYSSSNEKIFEPNGALEHYQGELKRIIDQLEKQLSGLQEVRKRLKS